VGINTYPEGVAAEILKVGQEHSDKKDDNDSDSPKEGMQLLLSGALTSGLFALFTRLRAYVWVDEASKPTL
jgi:uncharacterized oligopeptide transporter (OPT) family protein